MKEPKNTLKDRRPFCNGHWAVALLAGVALAGLALTGCGKRSGYAPRLTPLPEDAVILVYGAGISEEADFLRSSQMDESLSKATKRTIVNRGMPCEYAESALKRLPSVLDECDPDMMVLSYGAMDLWKATDRAKLKASLGAMVDVALKRKTQVVMLALPDISKVVLRPAPLFEEVAREKNVPIETKIVSSVLKTPSERIYRYMVNDNGLEAIGAAVRALCVKYGALKD